MALSIVIVELPVSANAGGGGNLFLICSLFLVILFIYIDSKTYVLSKPALMEIDKIVSS